MKDRPLDIVIGDNVQRFAHRAMATVFEVLVTEEDPVFAAQAARAVFEEIDRLEGELSRFRPNSDISRIRALAPGQRTTVGVDTFACLTLSKRISAETGGAFDVTIGPLMERIAGGDGLMSEEGKLDDGSLPGEANLVDGSLGMNLFELEPATVGVRVGARPPALDLGAIGKGYAVDRAAELLREWGVGNALVHSGTSSVLAFGRLGNLAGWPVTIRMPDEPRDLIERNVLIDRSLSGSGTVRRRHIVDPRDGRSVTRRAAWALDSSAACSDALSTAFMVMDPEEIARYSRLHPGAWIAIVEPSVGGERAQVLRFGVFSPAPAA
jgi:thiamine biosynthesis lipoprotein